jgi:hypothetical protein
MQLALQVIQAVPAVPVAVLLSNRGALAIDELKDLPGVAVLVVFDVVVTQPDVTARAVMGTVVPSGKLPYTFYKVS